MCPLKNKNKNTQSTSIIVFPCDQSLATALILQPIQIANITDSQMLKLNAVAVKKSFVETCPKSAKMEEEDTMFESGLLPYIMTYEPGICLCAQHAFLQYKYTADM